ncbi:integrin alpha [soil metagenome]
MTRSTTTSRRRNSVRHEGAAAQSVTRVGRATACGVAALLAIGAGTAVASTPATPYTYVAIDSPNPQPTARFGERTRVAGDVNGDGVNDLWVGTPSEDSASGLTNAGVVRLLDGASLPQGQTNVLLTIRSPEPQASATFGFFISVLGDVNNDAIEDIAIGTDAQDVGGNVDQGRAWVFSGRTGRVLYALDNPDPQPAARFGSRISAAGDITGDGRSEGLVGASNNDIPAGCGTLTPIPSNCRVNEGQAYIFNGRNGALVRTLFMPDPQPAPCTANCGSFGLSVQGPGDTNGNGVPDQLVSAPAYNAGTGRMYVFEGSNGRLRLRIDNPTGEPGDLFGFQDAAPYAPGDVNNDGNADLYGNGFLADGPEPEGLEEAGQAWVFNGRTGQVLYPVIDPTPTVGGQFGFALDRTDYDLDGEPDLYVGSSPHHLPGPPDQSGGTYVFEGSTGNNLKILELQGADRQEGTTGNLGSNLGWSVSAPGDLDGDGNPDYVAGAPFQDVTFGDQGRVFVFVSH